MSLLPISIYTWTGFYFSTFLYLASAFLLLAIYKFRWKSDSISLVIWLAAYAGAGVIAWLFTNELTAVLTAVVINLFLALCLCRLVPSTSLFGVFFFASMLSPSLFGLIWLYQLISSAIHHLDSLALCSLLVIFAAIFSMVIIANTVMWSWNVLMRFSPLYFRYPRLKEAWRKSESSKNTQPWVSIHVPCYNEPPDVVIQTLDALSRLQYQNFDVIVLDNNTKDPNIWKPVQDHCKKLGEKFLFHHIDSLPGAKAGALNVCLKLTPPNAELIAVLDADFISEPDFLEKLVGFFNDPKTGYVQTCQDFREWEHLVYQSACYFEYETHFKMELSGQSEWDMTYTIGTMCLIRRKALEEVGGWAEWCLTEDSEVAVRIHALGYAGHYLIDTFGRGLIPETFENYKQQRFRWTAGPVQQLQRHWRLYLPWSSQGLLSLAQKIGEIFHSSSVLFNETLSLLINIPLLGVCLWYSIAEQQSFIIPYIILLFIPISIIRNMICNLVAIRLLGGSWKNYIESVLASRSLVYTRNLAFYKAWLSKKLTWNRTDKFKASASFERVFYSTRQEILAGMIYLVIAIAITPFASFWPPDIIFLIWLRILNQVLSFLCAPIMAFLSEMSIKKWTSINSNDSLHFQKQSLKEYGQRHQFK